MDEIDKLTLTPRLSSGPPAVPKLLTPSENCIELVQHFETLRLDAYKDAVGVWTIGWGSTGNVKPGMVISRQEADERLRNDCNTAVAVVRRAVPVTELTQYEFDAVVSSVFNIGAQFLFALPLRGGTAQLTRTGSYLKTGNRAKFARMLLEWNRAGGGQLVGLDRRRCAERSLFLGEANWRRWFNMDYYLSAQHYGLTGIDSASSDTAKQSIKSLRASRGPNWKPLPREEVG